MNIPEEKIISIVEKTLNSCRQLDSDFNLMTILWHDNVLKMKGGRIYPKILEFLASQDDVEICKGIELANKIKKVIIFVTVSLFEAIFGRFGHNPSCQHMSVKTD